MFIHAGMKLHVLAALLALALSAGMGARAAGPLGRRLLQGPITSINPWDLGIT